MDKYEFYDYVDLKQLNVGSTLGRLKLATIVKIEKTGAGINFTATYKGQQESLLENKYAYSLKETIQRMDYLEYLNRKQKIIDDAMETEIKLFIEKMKVVQSPHKYTNVVMMSR